MADGDTETIPGCSRTTVTAASPARLPSQVAASRQRYARTVWRPSPRPSVSNVTAYGAVVSVATPGPLVAPSTTNRTAASAGASAVADSVSPRTSWPGTGAVRVGAG